MEDQALLEQKAVEELMDRWMNDPAFKGKLQADPASALSECGITLDDEQLAKLGSVDLDMSAEELQERITKGGGYN